MTELAPAIAAAWARRAALHADPTTDAYRVFHGLGDGAAGVAIDRFGDVARVDPPRARPEALAEVVAAVSACHPFRAVVADGQVVAGALAPEPVEVCEAGLRFAVDPRAADPGLFLDARPARAWLRAHAEDRLIASLFAHTGSLGVAAAAGGARAVTFVDGQKRQLARARDNAARNGLRVDDRDLVRADVYKFLRASKRRYDGIVLASAPRVPGRADQDYESLLPLALGALAPDGWILCFLHHRTATMPDAGLVVRWRATSGDDFPDPPPRRLRLVAYQRA